MKASDHKENTIGGVFNPKTASCREMDVQELHTTIVQGGGIKRMSWGFHNGAVELKNKCYRFSVSGHHHKGHVHIVLNGLDLFDIYYTSNRGTIKKIQTDVYIFDLIDRLDVDIEKIDDYVR